MNSRKIANILMIAGLALCLLHIWLPAYYVTGDGPCHLYNAQVLHDLWSGKNGDFYSRFYSQVARPNPNWMSHLLLALLLFVVQGPIAEKVLLTVYILLFTSGFYTLLRKLDGKSSYWPMVLFLFVFHFVLVKGFYNFSISIALLSWLLVTWLACLDNKGARKLLLFALLATLTFFAHPVAFVFGCFACFCFTITYAVTGSGVMEGGGKARHFFTYSALLTLCLLPGLLLFAWFASAAGGVGSIQLHLYKYRTQELPLLNSLCNSSASEYPLLKVAFWLLLVLFVISVTARVRNGLRFHKFDGLLLSLMFAGIVYLVFPDSLFGGSVFIFRVQLLLVIFAVCCIAYMLPAGWVKNAGGIALFSLFAALSFIRIQTARAAAEGVTDILSASAYIKPFSVVLPLCFAPGGKDMHGNTITTASWVFVHPWQYMGVGKPLILLDNYEANTGYFPLLWKYDVNPYLLLGKGGSFEGLPPYACIGNYKDKTGVTIDYLLMWCYDSSWLRDERFKQLYTEINAGYRIIYTSPGGRTILFARQ